MREICLPRLGWSMEEGTFVRWLAPPGEAVTVGQPLFEMEGDKALQEIESVDAGVLFVPADAPAPGAVIPVGALLGYLLSPGETAPQSAGSEKVAETVNTSIEVAKSQPAVSVSQAAAPPRTSGPLASPRARRVAVEMGVDWTQLAGSGRDGRVREADVLAAQTVSSGAGASSENLLTPRRKAIAARLRKSFDSVLPVTLTTTIDATHLVGLREQFRVSQAMVIPSYTDIAACLVAHVLAKNPQFALRWDEHHTALRAVAADDLHIGVAVDTPEGLLVPVVRKVRRKSLLAVAEETRSLIDRARSGRLTSGDMQGGVMTITNLGAAGIDAFTPIINDPEIAILGLGAIRREAVVLPDDRIVAQPRQTLSLTFDHAALDGAPAARLLREIAMAMETPAAQLMG